MDRVRIAELLQPFFEASPHHNQLSARQLDQISTYIDLLLRGNARMNLTAIRAPEQIVTRHFGESLFAARHLLPPAAGLEVSSLLVDIGSGAGFPGLPMKIWSPQTPVTLVESNHKKVAFLREVIRALTLTDIDVFPARAETLSTPASLVTLRAVEHFETILPVAISLLAPEATLALLIGVSQIAKAQALAPHLSWSRPLTIPNSDSRLVLTAQAPAPQK